MPNASSNNVKNRLFMGSPYPLQKALFQSFVCMDMDEERFCRVVGQPSDLSEQQLCSSLASLEFHPGSCFSDKRVEASPAPAIARNQQVSSLSTRAAGGIVGEVRCRKLRPGILERGDQTPFSFRLIAAGEQGSISTHGIKQ